MADAAIHPGHPATGAFEPSLFGTYSKKLGMWLFILSDSLTFGALLFAYSYGRISNPAWPTPFDSHSIMTASVMTFFLLSSSLTMVLAVNSASLGREKATTGWLLATMFCGAMFIVLHAMEWNGLQAEGMWPLALLNAKGAGGEQHFSKLIPQFGGTFVALTGMHMLHVTIGVIYLGVVALRKKILPILLGFWLLAWLLTPATTVFHYGAHVLLVGAIVCAVILFLKPKKYTPEDVEVAGLYWHFVDLVWMFIFPLVYLMSTHIQ